MKKTYKQLELFGWKFTLTPMRFVLTALLLGSLAVILVRMVTGYHFVTNLSDETPWQYSSICPRRARSSKLCVILIFYRRLRLIRILCPLRNRFDFCAGQNVLN